jgi:membrane protease subunit HflC
MKMNRVLRWLLALCVGAGLALYATSFVVRFDQTAVVTTFGRADEADVRNRDGQSAGFYFKWPWPIQQVRFFDTRLRLIEDRLEQQETKDKQIVILKTYLVWRVSDGLAFMRSMQDDENATRFLVDRLRTTRSEVGNYTLDELANTDPARLKLQELEERILVRLRQDLAGKDYGISIARVGVKRLQFPDQIANSVYERMRQTRRRLAQNAQSEGQAIAAGIEAKARSDRDRILAFANRKAQALRAEGDAAAARYYEVFARNEEFAVFVRKLEALETMLSNNSTFLIDSQTQPFDLLQTLIPAQTNAPAGHQEGATHE